MRANPSLTANVNVFTIARQRVNMNNEKATITTLAEVTGLSLATVSRALSGSDRVRPDTREKVLSAAKKLNYVRDRAAVRLKTGKTHVLAFIMDRKDVRHPGFVDLMVGVSDAVAGSDYHVIVLPDDARDPMATVRYVVERGLADGVVLSHTLGKDPRVNYLLKAGVPFVTHGRTAKAKRHGYVDFDNNAYATSAVSALAARGRKRLAMLLPPEGGLFREHLLQGFQDACARLDVTGEAITSVDLDGPPASIYDWATQHAAAFDGIVMSREAPVVALVGAMSASGLVVGRDLDLAIKYSTDLPRFIREPVLACFEDLHLAGASIGRGLLHHLGKDASALPQILFQPPAFEAFHHATRRTTKSR